MCRAIGCRGDRCPVEGIVGWSDVAGPDGEPFRAADSNPTRWIRRTPEAAPADLSVTREGASHAQNLIARTALAIVFAAGVLMVTLGSSAAFAASPNTGFGFNARAIAGGGTGAVDLTGGGAFNATTGFVHSGGGFSCTTTVSQGPLAGCLTGQGVRWDTASSPSRHHVQVHGERSAPARDHSNRHRRARADFYRAGDGNDESFNANMIVTTHDLDRDLPGIQNVWVQGVGCATAITHFSN